MNDAISEESLKKVKRGQGECHFRVLDNGNVYGRKMVGYQDNGKPKIVVATKRTKRECREELERKEREFKDHNLKESNLKKMTFGDFFWRWYETYKEIVYEDTTKLTRYTALKNMFENFRQFPVSDYPMERINSDVVQMYFNKLAGNYALSTIKPIEHLLKECMEYAVEKGIYQRNPMSLLRLKESSISSGHKKKNMNVLNDNDIELIKKEVERTWTNKKGYQSPCYRNGYAILLILFTGMRLGEALALRWNDIDLERGVLHITKALGKGRDMSAETDLNQAAKVCIVEKGTKTEAGTRTIALEPEAIYALGKLRELNATIGKIQPNDRILLSGKGNSLTEQALRTMTEKMCRNAGTSQVVSIHMLRHTYCSMLLRRGVRIEVVSKMLGHNNTSTTTEIYTHILKEQLVDRDALKIFDTEQQVIWLEKMNGIRSLRHSDKRDLVDIIIRLSDNEKLKLANKLVDSCKYAADSNSEIRA